MKKILFSLAALLALGAAPAPEGRPAIGGISHLAIYSADMAASGHFYGFILGGRKAPDPEDPNGVRYYFSPVQFVELLPLPPGQGPSRLAHAAYNVADAARLRAWLGAHGAGPLSDLHRAPDGSLWFDASDPEGNKVQFVQPGLHRDAFSGAISGRIIHIGYLVHDRAAEDRFYRKLLGFRPYWYGAMHEGAVDWISQQVPDGHDWLEYMMVGPGSTTPLDHVDARELGVLNHFSLGVPNMEKAVTRLLAEDRMSPRHDGPSMGRDGKWQANLYDPDGTRVELMEFQPVTKPCCSGFTAESPAG
ncbi:MAG TPA: VOC family protein [Allosphingosinicella sp.]|jgi:catechol 2,3-dioxygenase-like lactoylglutathione lyase family enzyme